MKSRFYYKALSITVSAAIMAASLQLANPVVVYAEEEESQADSGSDPLVVVNTESVSDETKATDGSGEGQKIESVSENAEDTKSNQELNIEEPEANEGVVGNGIPEVEIEAYADAMPEEGAAAVMNVQSEGMPEADVNTVSEEGTEPEVNVLSEEETESVSDETKATDGSGEGQKIESVSENAEDTKSNQELNIEETKANEGVVGNGIPEVEIEAYADAMPEEGAAAVMNIQSEGMPKTEVNTVSEEGTEPEVKVLSEEETKSEVNTVSEETKLEEASKKETTIEEIPTDEPVSEELAAESTLSGDVAQENADIENSKTDKAATEEDIFSEAELVTLELEEVSISEESTAKEDESETLSDEKSEKEDLTEGVSNQDTDSDAIGERVVLGEAPGDYIAEVHYPYNQYAVEGYGAENENRGDSATLDVVLGDGIRFILSGVDDIIVNNNEVKKEIVDTIKEFLGIDENNTNDGNAKTLQYMNSTAFIDAETYSIINEGYDSNYCWGATASNMLWLSGWAKEVLGYGNEDKIMSDLHDKFLDVAEEPRDAITWLFDNYINNVEVPTTTESTLGGKATSICISEAFNTYENVAGQLQNLASLANVASQAVGIQCHWTKDGQVKDGSHWLTAVGVVINEKANSIEDYFKAIILADSDDTPGTATTCPSKEESYNQRRDTINLYKICTLETLKVNGVDYWYIPGYVDVDGRGALITGIESLDYYSEVLKDNITEKNGTKDVSSSIELINSGEMYIYGESDAPQEEFCEESTNVRIGYTNVSNNSVENVQIPVRVKICDKNFQEIDSNVYYVSVDKISANSKGYFNVNIDDLTNQLSEGDYRVYVMFNPSDVENKLEEAYYLNNQSESFNIRITKKSETTEDDKKEESPIEEVDKKEESQDDKKEEAKEESQDDKKEEAKEESQDEKKEEAKEESQDEKKEEPKEESQDDKKEESKDASSLSSDYDSDSSSSDNSSSDSSSSQSQASQSTVTTPTNTVAQVTAVPTYISPEKKVVVAIDRVNTNGTITNMATHVDGSITETTSIPVSVVAGINATGISTVAPTVVNSISVSVDKVSSASNANISSVTAVLDVTTIGGKMNLTPQMISSIKNAVSSQVGAKESVDLKVNTLAADGKAVSVIVSTESLKNNASLKGFVKDPLTGGYIIVDVPNVKYNNKTGLSISGLTSGLQYQFVSTKEAKAIENSIVNSVKVSNEFANPVSVSAGSIVDMTKALSPSLNAINVSKVEYKVSGNKATINPVTGQLMISGDATKGTITVSIKVTLKNGKTKTVKTKIKIG